jgi:2-iminobutanoate/2-iminopropanoate deaminase
MSTPMREEWFVPTLQEPISHYTHAVSFGDLVFVSGCTATDEEGGLVGGDDVELQTYQVLRNLEEALIAAGSNLQHVLKVTLFLTDIRDRERINIARQKVFGAIRPASTLVEVSKLAIDGARVEIEVIACKASGTVNYGAADGARDGASQPDGRG